MSSRRDGNKALSFNLKLALWHAMLFVVTFVILHGLAYVVIGEAMEDEWRFQLVQFDETLSQGPAGRVHSITISEREARAVPNQQLRDVVEGFFITRFPWVAVPMLILGTLGGMLITGYAIAPLRSLAKTTREILRTGDVSRRVPVRGGRSETDQFIDLVNIALEKNEALIVALHESLDNVAHDLRTPLTRLRATAESALEHPDDAAGMAEAVADCMEESDRVLTILATLMDVAEAETGVMRLDRQELSLSDLVADVVDLYDIVAEEAEILVETELFEGLTIHADANRMRQALANLLDNAIKYSAKGTVVTISSRPEGELALLSVTDQGRGISARDQERIWDRLYRGDRSRSERGLGLGLSFVKAIVEAHGGTIAVESREDRGSTFSLRLE